VAVDQQRVGRLGDVGDVARIHAHPGEHLAVLLAELLAALPEQGLALAIEEAPLLLQPGEYLVRMHEAPIGEHDHMLAVVSDRIGAGRIDDHRPIMADLLLETRMAVVPIGARLPERKLIDEG